MPEVNLDGIDIHYEVSGSGQGLLFLNGSGASLADVAPLVSLLAERFEVLAFDQRGIGKSPCPRDPYTMADLAADALSLADHLKWERFRLMGISFGGMVAQEMAVTAPERIDRLALACTSPGGDGGSSFPLHTLAKMAPGELTAVAAEIMDTRFTPEWLEVHQSDRMLAAALTNRHASNAPTGDPGFALQLQARQGHDVFERLPRITCPTLVASGLYDGIAPPKNGAAIVSKIPHAEFRVFEGGHAFFIQDPTSIPSILSFLSAD
jgi:3-oxoadipate enol-lactonase